MAQGRQYPFVLKLMLYILSSSAISLGFLSLVYAPSGQLILAMLAEKFSSILPTLNWIDLHWTTLHPLTLFHFSPLHSTLLLGASIGFILSLITLLFDGENILRTMDARLNHIIEKLKTTAFYSALCMFITASLGLIAGGSLISLNLSLMHLRLSQQLINTILSTSMITALISGFIFACVLAATLPPAQQTQQKQSTPWLNRIYLSLLFSLLSGTLYSFIFVSLKTLQPNLMAPLVQLSHRLQWPLIGHPSPLLLSIIAGLAVGFTLSLFVVFSCYNAQALPHLKYIKRMIFNACSRGFIGGLMLGLTNTHLWHYGTVNPAVFISGTLLAMLLSVVYDGLVPLPNTKNEESDPRLNEMTSHKKASSLRAVRGSRPRSNSCSREANQDLTAARVSGPRSKTRNTIRCP
ncbi:MAG: hypothetical protein CMF51_03435 [Legionellales bacterium]|nr:hypothetical protein [Legionellales bacterium]